MAPNACLDRETPCCGQFIRKTTGKARKDWWGWLQEGCLKRTTEALIMTAREQGYKNQQQKNKK